MKNLENKTAIITGGSKGIGKGIVEKFAQEGCNIAFTYLSSESSAIEVEKNAKSYGVKVIKYKSDASNFDQSSELIENVIKDSEIVHPEPYTQWAYYNQQCSLAEAFDKVINETEDHSDLGKPNMYLCKTEEKGAANALAGVKAKQNKDIQADGTCTYMILAASP